ncbi:MAG: hypothetical protein CMJ48_00245 [Planctomycetaceae bacterium]|nr:hypothetical protein [Planctomycetaceae bacterium]
MKRSALRMSFIALTPIVFLAEAAPPWKLKLKKPMGGPAVAVKFSPDSQLLAGGFGDHTRVWELAGEDTLALRGSWKNVSAPIAFAPDGKTLVGSINVPWGGIVAVDISKPKPTLVIKTAHNMQTSGLDISPDGRFVVTGGSKTGRDMWRGDITLWNLPKRSFKSIEEGHDDSVCCVAISPDGKAIAAGDRSGQIQLWSIPDLEPRATFAIPKDQEKAKDKSIRSVAFSPDGKTLASTQDETIRLWDVTTRKHKSTLRKPVNLGHSDFLRRLVFSPDGKLLASGGSKTVRLWNVATGNVSAEWTLPLGVRSLDFSPDGKLLATGIYGRPSNRITLSEIWIWQRTAHVQDE